MSYMELKRRHQNLMEEKESQEKSSRQKESRQRAMIDQLAQEIQQHKVCNYLTAEAQYIRSY